MCDDCMDMLYDDIGELKSENARLKGFVAEVLSIPPTAITTDFLHDLAAKHGVAARESQGGGSDG